MKAIEQKIGQRDRVYNTMLSGNWLTLSEIHEKTGDAEASISAQLRHLRKERFGSHVIEKRINSRDVNGHLWEYKLQRERKCMLTLEKQLDEIYEAAVGDNGRERFTHEELVEIILDFEYAPDIRIYNKTDET
jgi:predicted transcriptional regulator